jgi:hypothetical protein
MTDTSPPAPPRRRSIRPETLLHVAALLTTTAVLTATSSKLPPFKGD